MAKLCNINSCRRLHGHNGNCDTYPSEAWGFFEEEDKKKISKTSSATPRGGKKGGYQNHVNRCNKVIVPYEKVEICNLESYEDGFIIRVLPEQIFNEDNSLKDLLTSNGLPVVVGENAFVLYGSHEMYELHAPVDGWVVRHLEDANGNKITQRHVGVVDRGHYILRLPAIGGGASIQKHAVIEGSDQGIFAPEYATKELTYLSQIVLSWQTVHTVDSPYTSNQASHIKAILDTIGINSGEHFSFYGMMRGELSICPLCLKKISYGELHAKISLVGEDSLQNSGTQIRGATRSTIINLFHMMPLEYGSQYHTPLHVSWGHATCNTKLGQRKCWSLEELKEHAIKVAKVQGEQISTFGWISDDEKMIRSPLGAVWIKVTDEMSSDDE